MSANKALPHVLVLPEDDANRQLANGFHVQISLEHQRQMQILNIAGGWIKTLNIFALDHQMEMNRYPHRSMVLLIDLDGDEGRLEYAKSRIPEHLQERVFILSVLTEPEDLDETPENIGAGLANDCRRRY